MTSKLFRNIVPVVIGIATLSSPGFLHAQAVSSLVTNRLTQPIDESAHVTLRGTVHPLANRANDRGAAPDSMPLERIQIVLQRSSAQESAVQQLIHDEHTKGTANYHKWLTPAQFGEQFGPSDQDIATLEAWLQSRGFNILGVSPGKQTLDISGNVAQFRSAFHAQIHKYSVNGQTHYANAGDPQIPAALAPVFSGFVSLNNFHPHRFSHVLGQASYNPKTGQAIPQWTYGTNAAGVNFVLAPSDFAVQYDLPASLTGKGQTIAIINDSNINIALVNQFRTLFGLPANPPQVIIDGNDPGIDGINNPEGPNFDSVEAYLDVEWSGAVAPLATVDLVIGADTSLENGFILAAERAVNSNLAPVMSVSFGLGCESQLSTYNQFINALWEQAAAQGITVMVSTGDNAAAGCDNDNTQYYAVNGAAISGLASTPWDIAVGGTDFFYSDYATGGASIANYWNETPSPNPSTSIKGVIPEQPWNNSQYGLNVFSIYNDSVANGNPQTSIAGASGGVSTVYSKPVWQSGPGVPSDSHRDIPDVSLFAANGLNASYYPICYADADCQPASGSSLIQITGIGGTSASSPAFAGIMALVNQKYGRQGQADYVLYPLAKQYPAAFHDVTNGTNSVPCAYSATSSLNTPDCIAVSNPITVTDPNLGTAVEGQIGTGTTAWWNATPGYDLASGLGSVDASMLIDDWGSVSFSGTNVSLTSPTAGTTITHGSPVTFSGAVTGTGSSTPTGNVAIETDSTEPGQQSQGFPGLFYGSGSTITPSTLALTNGSFSGSISTLPGGTYNVWANYGGDTTNSAAQSGKTQITVSPEASSVYFAVNDVATGRAGAGPAISSGATNIPYGTQLILSAQVAPSSQLTAFENCQASGTGCPTFTMPTGTMVFADNGSDINTAVVNAEGDAEYNSAFAVGSHSVTGKYSGDNSYNASTSSAITFSTVKDTPNINLLYLSTQSGALVTGQSNAITIQVLNSANLANESNLNIGYSVPAAAPTGTVTISGLPSGSPTSATLQASVDPQTASPAGVATIALPANVSGGPYNVTVTYNGDSNYAAANKSQQISFENTGGVATSITASVSGSISPTTSVTLSGTVTGKSGDGAPQNTDGGILVLSNGYYLQISLVPGSGDTSTFSTTLNSQTLLQGANAITVQYLGDNTYAPSAITLTPSISNPLSDFSMVPNTTIVPVTVGTAATDTIQLSPVNGFSNSVSFTCTAPSGVTCSLSPTSYAFSGGASTTTLTLNASASAPDGNNSVLVTGVDSTGKFVHTLNIQADVTGATAPVAGFTVLASPSNVTFTPGATTGNTSNVIVTPAGGFTGNVALTAAVTAAPSGATSPPTVSFASNSLNVTGQSTFSSMMSIATTSSTTTGNYTITVTGASGSANETTALNVIVGTPTPANFALTNSGNITITSPGATTGNTSTLTVTPSGSFTGMVNFTCAVTTSPAGAIDPPTCSAPAANVTGTGAVTSTLTANTTAKTSGALHRPLDKFFAASGGIAIAALLFFGIPARRRNWRSMIAVLLFAGLVSLGIGCGSGGSGGGGGGGTGGTTTGAYVLTVTATDAATGKITSSATVNLTVN